MLYLTALVLPCLFLYFLARRAMDRRLEESSANYRRLQEAYDTTLRETRRLKADNAGLERSTDETIALYDVTRDMCKTLDESEIFALFKEKAARYVNAGDCLFLKAGGDISRYRNYTILPLTIHRNIIGYLLVSGIYEKDQDKFQILAQQFLMGLKRSLLYQKVQELTITDTLTGVFNRRHFLEKLNQEAERSRKIRRSFAFLMVDADYFKKINDTYGHLVGDVALKETAAVIKDNIREIDFMGRYGGEELAIVLSETGKDQAFQAGERIRLAVASKKIKAYDEALRLTISVGISVFPDDSPDPQEIIEKADRALYAAKQAGRNRVEIVSSQPERQGSQ